jgi:hypothetical protein
MTISLFSSVALSREQIQSTLASAFTLAPDPTDRGWVVVAAPGREVIIEDHCGETNDTLPAFVSIPAEANLGGKPVQTHLCLMYKEQLHDWDLFRPDGPTPFRPQPDLERNTAVMIGGVFARHWPVAMDDHASTAWTQEPWKPGTDPSTLRQWSLTLQLVAEGKVVLPMSAEYHFQLPPGWPAQKTGWAPPDGWKPHPSWPPAPSGWVWWKKVSETSWPGRDGPATTANSNSAPSVTGYDTVNTSVPGALPERAEAVDVLAWMKSHKRLSVIAAVLVLNILAGNSLGTIIGNLIGVAFLVVLIPFVWRFVTF